MTQVAKLQTKKSKGTAKLTAFDRFSAFSYKVFGWAAGSLAAKMPTLKDEILKSNMRTTPIGLLAAAMLATALTSVVAVAAVVLALVTGFLYPLFAALAPPIVFVFMLNGPKISQSARAYALNNELAFVIGYMVVLAGGGVSPMGTLKKIAKMAEIFPAASKEAKTILVDIEVFGLDPISALERAARFNPARLFSELLLGYTTVLKTGGDFGNYLNVKLKEVFEFRSSQTRRAAETIGTMAEAYMTVTALLGLTLFVLYEVQAVLAHDTAGLQNLFVFAFVAVPLISAVFLWIIDGVQAKEPLVDYRPYKIFGACAPIGLAVFALPIPIPLYIHMSLALFAMTIVPAFYSIRYAREKRGLEKALPDFIRDMAEGRKIGLPPETAIEQLAEKNYGTLSKHVKKMGAQISWGLDLHKIVRTFIAEVHSWVTKTVGVLMVEVVDVGGGTVKSFSDMADFTRKINDIEDQKRGSLKPYILVMYFAGVIVVVTTFLMAYLLTQAITSGPSTPTIFPTLDPGVVDLLFTASIFEGWVVGMVAGKMGGGNVSDGFKHALILVGISLVTIFIGKLFISLPI